MRSFIYKPGTFSILKCAAVAVLISCCLFLIDKSKAEAIKGVLMSVNDESGNVIEYETSHGKLKANMLLENENQRISMSGSTMKIVHGFYFMSADNAMPVGKELQVYSGATVNVPLNITLIQDKRNGNWLATDGRIFINNDTLCLLEGHEIQVIDGRDDPIYIAGQSFSDATVVIKNGKPVAKNLTRQMFPYIAIVMTIGIGMVLFNLIKSRGKSKHQVEKKEKTDRKTSAPRISETVDANKKPAHLLEYLDSAGGTDELYEMLRSRPASEIEEICRTYPIEDLRIDWDSIQKDFLNNRRFELITLLAQILVQYRDIIKEGPERKLPDALPSEQLTEILMSRLISFIKKQKNIEIAQGLRIRLYDFAMALIQANRNSDALHCLLASKPSIKEGHDFWICACRHNIAMTTKNPDDISAAVKAVEDIVNGKVSVPERYVEGARNMLANLQKL